MLSWIEVIFYPFCEPWYVIIGITNGDINMTKRRSWVINGWIGTIVNDLDGELDKNE